MFINIPPVPDEVRRAFLDGLDFFLDEPDRVGDRLKQAPPPGLPVFTLTLDDLGQTDWARRVKPAGWRFLGADPAGGWVAGDVMQTKESRTHELMSVSRDRVLRDAVEILARLQAEKDETERFDVALLRIPALLTEMLWLRPKESQQSDHVIPILTSSPEIEIGKSYPVAAFEQMVQPLIEKFRRFDEIERRPPASAGPA